MKLSPPHFGDKFDDWRRLAEAGGEALLTNKDVLDIGPCYGLDVFAFAPKTRSYTVIDSDPTVLAHMSWLSSGPRFNLIHANLKNGIPCDDEFFDTVFDFGTLDNVLGGIHLYQEAIRILRRRGVFICSYANREVLSGQLSDSGDEERFTFDELQRALIDAGATQVTSMDSRTHARAGLIARK
jgi:SAM-dependent methyltransferase